MAVARQTELPELPLRLELYPVEVRERLEQALADVLAMDPLPLTEAHESRSALHELPAQMPSLVALHGYKRCGKTSLADFIERRYRDIAQIGFSEPMIAELNSYLAPSGHVLDDQNKADTNYRFLLQMWTQARRLEDPDYWLRPLRQGFDEALAAGARLVLMPGLREPNEKAAVESWGGEVWKVVNPNLPKELDRASRHPIELALDHLPDEAFARVIVNDAPTLRGWCEIAEAVVESYRRDS